jgi:predicted regulator of Ras-like GTPase activity (Roadblock/LC7/MglB family)
MNTSDRLRHERLVFYQSDMERIDRVLAEFLRLSAAKCALLIDKGGHLVTCKGDVKDIDMDTISALVAGSFAATREMARLLGEEEFSVLFHQGERDNIQLSLVGDRTLLSVIFDERTTVGMVRLYANESTRKLVEIFADAIERQGSAKAETADLEPTYQASAKDRLASLFGGASPDKTKA